MAGFNIKEYFRIDAKPTKGLVALEKAVVCYTLLTLVLMFFMRDILHSIDFMLYMRFRILAVMVVLWGVYRLVPCPFTMMLRILLQMIMLGDWYTDTYEFNRSFLNLDHIFCNWEHTIFGCQPSLELPRLLPWGIVSEPLDMAYFSFYPIVVFTSYFYFFCRTPQFLRATYIIMASFFSFYIIFIFLPVVGPTYYFKAVGVDIIEQGVFPSIGHYFETHSASLPSPGWTGGLFYKLVEFAKWAGERPTAAFPSSHMGITTVCMFLLWKSNNRKVFYSVLPIAVLMFFATFYIQAHYLIDSIAGIFVGTAFYYFFSSTFDYFTKRKKG